MKKNLGMLLAGALLLLPMTITAQSNGDAAKTAAASPSNVAAPAFGSDMPNFQRGYSTLPNLIKPYGPLDVPPAPLNNSPRVDQLMKDGKIMLSLGDAIALAIENNLDVAIQRYNPLIADTDILRTKAGSAPSAPRGGVTSGSNVGVSSTQTFGGVSQASGGSGSTIGSFDPVITSTMQIQHTAQPITSVNNLRTQPDLRSIKVTTGAANFGFQQAFISGTALNFSWNNSRQTNPFNSLVPQVNSNFSVQISQHLLNGFGFAPNVRSIRVARNNREVSDLVFKQQIITTVSVVQNTYWDLVSAGENVNVAERSLQVSEKLYNDNKRQVEIGTLAPIEVVRAEAEVAARRQDLIVAQTNLQQISTSVKNLVLRNISDTAILAAAVIPTDRISVPPVEPVVPLQDLIGTALSSRPELSQSRIDLTNRNLNIQSAKNALLPFLDGFVTWGGTGSAGALASGLTPDLVAAGAPLVGGIADSLGKSFGGDFPTYAFGVQLQIPLHNRSAQANVAQAQLDRRQSDLRLRQLENQVRVEVTNALIALQQNRARIQAAQKQRELAERSLDAEQKKFQLGASTNYLVIQAQRDLTSALSGEVAALGSYMKSRVEMDRSTGQTVFSNGIVLDEAFKGQLTKTPKALPVSKQD